MIARMQFSVVTEQIFGSSDDVWCVLAQIWLLAISAAQELWSPIGLALIENGCMCSGNCKWGISLSLFIPSKY